jgi:histone acetyltransferase (RNA polymerase elongator complex component)
MKRRILPFFFPNVGCPGRCIFCDQQIIAGDAFTMPTTGELVEAVMEAWTNRTPGDNRPLEAALFGGTFTALPAEVQEEVLTPLQALSEKGILQGIRISTHPQFVTPETLSFLGRFGVTTIELGIQSFADDVLHLSGREYDGEMARQACRAVQDAGLELVIQLMLFLPGALATDDLDSARLAALLKPTSVRLFPTVVLAGTTLARWHREGSYVPATVEQAVSRVAEMLEILVPSGTDIMRIGLQPSGKTGLGVLAGPYHDALGELCWSRLLTRTLAQACTLSTLARTPDICLHQSLSSLLFGHSQKGLQDLQRLLNQAGEKTLPKITKLNDLQSVMYKSSDVLWQRNCGKFQVTRYTDVVRVIPGVLTPKSPGRS